MRPLAIPALAFTLLAIFSPDAGAFEPARITLANEDEHGERVRFDVAGTWPDTCPPQLASVSAQGRDVVLLATRETEGCRATPTPYAFSSQVLERRSALPVEGIHRIQLQVEGADSQAPALAGFALVQVGGNAAEQALETGFWWADQGGEFGAGPGLGLSVETQANLISLSVMGYEANGESAWYFGAGELRQGIAHLDLGQFEGGAGPFARYAAPEAIQLSGWVDVETITPSRAVLWFSRADAGTGMIDLKPLSIIRFSFAQNPGDALLGRWLVAGDEAGSRPTRWLQFTRSEAFDSGFVLHEAQGSATLQCDLPPGQPASTPVLCRLDLGDGDAIEFTEVALRRLSGWDSGQRRTVAFRLD